MKTQPNLLRRHSTAPEPAGFAPTGSGADARAHLADREPRSSSFLGAALTRLAVRISPLVKADLVGALVAELERHFNEQLLSELRERVAAIVARELPERVEAIVARELPERVEAIVARELPERVEAIVARELPERVEARSADVAVPGGVTADDVIASIEMILGRTPDQALVDYHLTLGFADRFALGKYMMSTDEFRVQLQLSGGNWRHLFHSFATAGSFETQRRSLEVLRLLTPYRAKGVRKARFGSPNDGGYILIDDFDSIDAALSFGIGDNVEWDVSVADRGVPVYQFDHTIDAPPVSRQDLIFAKKRVVPQVAPGCETLNELAERHGKAGVPSLILKIDIEADEWAVFDVTTAAALSCFAQIVGEFHGFGSMIDPQWNARARRVFEKITRQFGVVHVHATNYAGFHSVANVTVPEALEITFANRSRYRLVATDEVFPGPLDAPNNPYVVDLHLGKFVY
jgi:hypothetical protein